VLESAPLRWVTSAAVVRVAARFARSRSVRRAVLRPGRVRRAARVPTAVAPSHSDIGREQKQSSQLKSRDTRQL